MDFNTSLPGLEAFIMTHSTMKNGVFQLHNELKLNWAWPEIIVIHLRLFYCNNYTKKWVASVTNKYNYILKKSVSSCCVKSGSTKTPTGKATAENPFHKFW